MTNLQNKFTTVFNEYKGEADKLNKQFKAFQETIQNLGQTDLKLHNVADYYMDNFDVDEDEWEIFNTFCEIRFEDFQEYLKETNMEIEQLGRTSAFWFVDTENIYDFNAYEMLEDESIFSTLGYEIPFTDLLEQTFINDNVEDIYNMSDVDEDDLDNFMDNLDSELYDLTEIFKDFKVHANRIIKAHNDLDSFKNNSVEDFKGFLEANDL